MRLKNKVAVVTGAGQGIGRETVMRFVEEGAKVYALDLNAELLHALKQACACETQVLDVCDRAAVDAFAATFPTLDILFNGVGYVHAGTIEDCAYEDWQRSFALNVDSMFHMIQALLPALLASGQSSVINMSSVASSIKGAPNRFAYGATKAAIIGMTKALAADYVTRGLRVNAICPGTVQTPSLEERLRVTGDYEQARAAFVARQPMGRVGTAREIADLAVYLGSDESAFTTGASHIIDGAWSN